MATFPFSLFDSAQRFDFSQLQLSLQAVQVCCCCCFLCSLLSLLASRISWLWGKGGSGSCLIWQARVARDLIIGAGCKWHRGAAAHASRQSWQDCVLVSVCARLAATREMQRRLLPLLCELLPILLSLGGKFWLWETAALLLQACLTSLWLFSSLMVEFFVQCNAIVDYTLSFFSPFLLTFEADWYSSKKCLTF